MGAKVTFDPTTQPYKTIFITDTPVPDANGDPVIEIDVAIDIYSDGKEDWLADANLRKHAFPVSAVGGNPLPGSRELGSTFFLSNDWKIAPYEGDHKLLINGNFYRNDGGSLYLNTVGAFTVQIEQQVSSLVDSTIQQLPDIEFSSFLGGVWYQDGSPHSGTVFPTGTRREPVNNLVDAYSIAIDRGFNVIYVLGDLTVTGPWDFQNFIFKGQARNLSTLTVDTTPNVFNATFEQATITGTLDGDAFIIRCAIQNLNFVSGVALNCSIEPGTITLGGGIAAKFYDCESGLPGVSTPIIDMGGSGQALAMRGYNGGIKLANKTGTDDVSIDLNSGQVILAPTVTNGLVAVRGVGKLIDESGTQIPTGTWNGVTIINETIDSQDIHSLVEREGMRVGVPVLIQSNQITFGGKVITITGNETVGYTLTRTA